MGRINTPRIVNPLNNQNTMKTLSNDKLTIQVADRGAELVSIQANGQEYLWQADPKFWQRHSPVLFPIVGRVWDNHFMHNGRRYELSQHGFARDSKFQLTYEEDDALIYTLESSKETMKVYPFPFVLQIGYRLKGNRIEVMWCVENNGDEDMFFQIGGHPAFNYRNFKMTNETYAYLKMSTKEDYLQFRSPAKKGCVGSDVHSLELKKGWMSINSQSFSCDTYIFEDSQLNKITLADADKNPYLSLEFKTPLVAIWSPSMSFPDVPFICIEPWYGRCDRIGYEGEFKNRDWVQCVKPRKSFHGGYSIIIEDI